MTPIICNTEAKTKIAKNSVKKESLTRLLNKTKLIFPDASLSIAVMHPDKSAFRHVMKV